MLDWENMIAKRRKVLALWSARLMDLIIEMRVQLTTSEVVWILIHRASEMIRDWVHDTWQTSGYDEIIEELRKLDDEQKP